MTREKAILKDNVVKFVMRCKRDSFAPEHRFNVEINIAGVPVSDLIPFAFGGASFRVKLQAWMRAHWTEAMFVQKAKETLKLTFAEVVKGAEVPLADKMMALSKEDFTKILMDDLGASAEEAEAIYNRKHGIVEEAE